MVILGLIALIVVIALIGIAFVASNLEEPWQQYLSEDDCETHCKNCTCDKNDK